MVAGETEVVRVEWEELALAPRTFVMRMEEGGGQRPKKDR